MTIKCIFEEFKICSTYFKSKHKKTNFLLVFHEKCKSKYWFLWIKPPKIYMEMVRANTFDHEENDSFCKNLFMFTYSWLIIL